jgi:hypothetical protein
MGVLALLGTGYVFSFALFKLRSSSMIVSTRSSAVEAGRPVPLGAPVWAVGKDRCRPCFLEGWHSPEPAHMWQRSERAVILVRVDAADAPPMLTLVLDMGAAINRSARKRDVEVFVNGHSVGRAEVHPEGNAAFVGGRPLEHRLPLPSSVLGPSGLARIEIVSRPLYNPMREHGTRDGRWLGVALRSLRFEASAK